MKKNRRNSNGVQKEKIFIIGASVFVLTALTLTGVYVSDKGNSGNNGNMIDFSELENQANNQKENTEQQKQKDVQLDEQAKKEKEEAEEFISQANSMKVENEKKDGNSSYVTSKTDQEKYESSVTETEMQKKKYGEQALLENTKASGADTTGEKDIVASAEGNAALHFTESDGLEWPIAGKVLLNYSMDKAIFYPTMQQYRYNPSIVIGATTGAPITAAADGIVESVFKDAELGQGIMCSLGDDYELTYGQLKDIAVSEGDMVKKGELIGYVADPTIYYSQEGSNVYFKLTHDGTPVDPMLKLGQ